MIDEKEIEMPVTVLFDGCRDCPRLSILVRREKLYADCEFVSMINKLACMHVDECKVYAKIVENAMSK